MKAFADRRAAQLSAYEEIKRRRWDNRPRRDDINNNREFYQKNQAAIDGIITTILDLLDSRVSCGMLSVNVIYANSDLEALASDTCSHWRCVIYFLREELGYTVESGVSGSPYEVFSGTTYTGTQAPSGNPFYSFSVKL
jgi:hypothetical protein